MADYLAQRRVLAGEAEVPPATVMSVAEKHFVTDMAAFRQENDRARMTVDPLLRR
ncbi:hypothetical protein [Streptomyces tubercidicus]|uniref:Uncharacterized protein n=1 Tax=Streptomyces tubercidicus TaxID=47759 RepID=A0A640V0S9_9ACTN|nr:hypothetical protein [Streptomyces tubercidicus]WAU09975.1 hypothetical protein STRTU_000007 [Streptomyces tubercidicus]WAU16352.1 hypothetical protein STRTU_007165 [Streptomyces tubercidicus]GFE40551.1 hypothetical protein Stube_52240 [Streptomyces tubercidicus]